ncbi:MAG: response regulator [Candidatus Eisenbacteria bacterium]|uniref:histidine kinase n=1 Tax=Eiseniibacteriota bacterium TaxID=2212470 RepID=A0A933W7L4_UNCEI|nr:response regulator [Candidatus Eisenbacteria bacterium]
MRGPDVRAIRVRIPLILLASGILLALVAYLVAAEMHAHVAIDTVRDRLTRLSTRTVMLLGFRSEAPADVLDYAYARMREGPATPLCLALVRDDGTVTLGTHGTVTDRPLAETLPAPVAARVLAVADTMPASPATPRPYVVAATRLPRGPHAGERLVIAVDASRLLAVARWQAAVEAMPSIGVGLVLLAVITLLLDRWLRGPAEQLERTAIAIAAGDGGARSGLRGESELERVGAALDHMADEIERAQRELVASRARLETALQALPAAVFLTDRATGRILFVSARGHGSALGRMVAGDTFLEHVEGEEFFHADGTPMPLEDLATPRALRTGQPASIPEFVVRHRNGVRAAHAVYATPISLRGGPDFDAVLTVVQARDEIVALTGELRRWEDRFQKVVEATGQVVYEWDFVTGTVHRTGNQKLVLGFSAEDERTVDALEHWRTRVHPDDHDRVVAAFDRCRERLSPLDVEYRYRRNEREWIWIHDRGFFEADADGRVVRLYGTMADVTAHHETEAQLRQAQKMETVGTLAGGIAHDFNNQLTGVIGHLDLLEHSLAGGDERAEHVRTARVAAERCAELTRGLLAFSRRLHSQTAPASLDDTVLESVRLLRRVLPANIHVVTELGSGVPFALIDVTQIQQVILNLCVNARDAMPGGGTLTLTTGAATLGEADHRHPDARPGRWARLRVKDDGAGIPPDVLPRVFEPFFTTKPVGEGTGLGLAMVYGIVSKHGGWIEVESREGKGTCFEIWLPAAPPETQPAGAPRPAGEPPRARGELVMIVDDEAVLRQLACRTLREQGFRVLEASGAEEALAIAREHAAELRAVVLDLTMPGMSGAEALPLLRACAPRAVVLMTSGHSGRETAEFEGAAGFLPKPWSPSELCEALRRAIHVAG